MPLGNRELKAIKDRIQTAIRFSEREIWPLLSRARELYAGLHWPGMRHRSDTARIVYNILYPAVETKVANLAFNYPDFVLKPLNRRGFEHAEVARHVIAYDWRLARAQEEARRALRDREIYGIGITYVYWLFEVEPEAGKRAPVLEGARPREAMESSDKTPDEAAWSIEAPGRFRVRTDRPACKRISPWRFFVSPEAEAVLDTAEYCGFRELVPLEKVLLDPRYGEAASGLIGTAKPLLPFLDDRTKEQEDAARPIDCRRVRLVHYYERERKLHVVMAEEESRILLVEEWPWAGDWYPFAVIRSPDEEDKFWPLPPLIRVEHQQLEINEARTQHSNWLRQAVPKFQTRGSLDAKQRQAIKSGRAGTVVEGLDEPVSQLPTPSVQREVMEASAMALEDLRFALGLNAYETATPPTKRMTTSEVEAIRLSGGSRAVSDRQAFELFCSEQARRFLALEQQYSVRSRELPIFDREDNVSGFRDYTREEIAGEFLVEVVVGSTTAPKADDILQQIGFLMQSLPGFIQAMQVAESAGVDLKPLLPRLLKAALPDLRDVEQELLSKVVTALPAPLFPPEAGLGLDLGLGLPAPTSGE